MSISFSATTRQQQRRILGSSFRKQSISTLENKRPKTFVFCEHLWNGRIAKAKSPALILIRAGKNPYKTKIFCSQS